MEKNLRRVIAGTLSALLVGQVMIFGDGTAQGILHKETLTAAAEAIEGMKNAKQLKEEFDAATDGLGEVEYFTMPGTNLSRRTLRAVGNTTSSSTEDETEFDVSPVDTLTVSGCVVKGIVMSGSEQIVDDSDTPIYVRIFNGNWEELSAVQVTPGEPYSVTASGSDVYNVKFECDGYLPFYLKNYGTGSFIVGSGESDNTITLVPGDTTYNEQSDNQWSDDVLNTNDYQFVLDHYGAQRGNAAYNPSIDIDNDGEIQWLCEKISVKTKTVIKTILPERL